VTQNRLHGVSTKRAGRIADNNKLPDVTSITRTECMWGGRSRNTDRTLRNQQRAVISTGRVLG
jgi:hypothetical protein